MNENTLPAVPVALPDEDLPDLAEHLSAKKRLLLAALRQTMGNKSAAARVTGIPYRTVKHWIQTDPILKQIVESEEFEEQMLDLAENKLIKKIDDGDTIATIFFLKTKGKKRGYVEKEAVASDVQNPQKKPSWFVGDQKELPDCSEFEPGFEDAVVISETKNNSDAETPIDRFTNP